MTKLYQQYGAPQGRNEHEEESSNDYSKEDL